MTDQDKSAWFTPRDVRTIARDEHELSRETKTVEDTIITLEDGREVRVVTNVTTTVVRKTTITGKKSEWQ